MRKGAQTSHPLRILTVRLDPAWSRIRTRFRLHPPRRLRRSRPTSYSPPSMSLPRTLPLALLLSLLPIPLLAQSAGPEVGLGYGVTQSRLRSGEAMSIQAAVPLWSRADGQLRGEFLYQWGRIGGRGCERLEPRYCIGGTDRNQILGAGAALHLHLGSLGPVGLFVPVGAGLYQRRTDTTETEGPIELCVVGNELIACPGNPPLRSIEFRTRASVPGYSVGMGMRTRIGGLGVYADARLHGLVERDSRAGALPLSVGFSF
jgi:hypothetical protein